MYKGEIFHISDVTSSKPMGSKLVKVHNDRDPKWRYVATGLDLENVWAVAQNGDVYKRTGFTGALPSGNGWSKKEGANLKQISVGNCQVFGVNLMH
jgi:hypothetical protein